jgi:hypothetical protein
MLASKLHNFDEHSVKEAGGYISLASGLGCRRAEVARGKSLSQDLKKDFFRWKVAVDSASVFGKTLTEEKLPGRIRQGLARVIYFGSCKPALLSRSA